MAFLELSAQIRIFVVVSRGFDFVISILEPIDRVWEERVENVIILCRETSISQSSLIMAVSGTRQPAAAAAAAATVAMTS